MSQIDPECFLVISYNKEFQKHLNMCHSQLKLVPKTADTFFTKKFHPFILWMPDGYGGVDNDKSIDYEYFDGFSFG